MRWLVALCAVMALAHAGSAAARGHRFRAASHPPAAGSATHAPRTKRAKAVGEEGFFRPYRSFHATSVYGRQHNGVY
jgi:hypothetical protein